MKYFLTVPVLLLLLAGCENPITFVWEVDILSDSDSYFFTDTATLTIANRSEESIDIRLCNDSAYFTLQRQITVAEWIDVYSTECPGDAQFESLTVGQSIDFPIDFSVVEGDERITGTYRLEFIIYPEGDRRVRLPSNMRQSNSFSITEQDEGDNDT